MFTVMTDNTVFSNHDTREQAEAEIAKVRKETLEEAERLIEEAAEFQTFADSFTIEEKV